jgi:hypothetical protein
MVDDTLIAFMLGQCFHYAFLLAVGTRGGTLLAWNSQK